MTARWSVLARIGILHDYHVDGICRAFDWTPSRATAALLSALRLRCKIVDHQLLVLVEVDAGGKPLVAIPPETRLVFRFELLDPAFMAFTNLDEDLLRSRRFHFANLGGTSAVAPTVDSAPLPRSLPAWDAGRKYVPGAFVRHAGNTYECQRVSQGNPPDPAGTSFWVPKPLGQYASGQDLVPLRGMSARYTLASEAAVHRVQVFGLDSATGNYSEPLLESLTELAPDPTSEVVVDLSTLPPGRYRVVIDGEEFESWHDDDVEGVFGIVELFHRLPASDPFSPLDATGKVRGIAYDIRFANRRAFWKYLTPLHKVADIRPTVDHALASPFAAGSLDPSVPSRKDFFVSLDPLPLSEAAGSNAFDLLVGSDARPAPRPDPRRGGTLTRAFDPALGVHTDTTFTIRLQL